MVVIESDFEKGRRGLDGEGDRDAFKALKCEDSFNEDMMIVSTPCSFSPSLTGIEFKASCLN